jgi:hypothetical protein
MQKRKTGILPMTEADRNGRNAASNRRLRHKHVQTSDLVGLGKLMLGILALGLIVVVWQRKSLVNEQEIGGPIKVGNAPVDIDDSLREHPLHRYESLQYALDNSKIVALYFAASWCPMSTPVTNLIHDYFDDILLPPPPTDNAASNRRLAQRHGLSLVHVSSDVDEESMQKYIGKNWMAVPYNSPDRNALKEHFKTCAKRELSALGFKRKHEIPTLIVISGTSHEVLTFDGVRDVREHGAQAVDTWMELASLSDALSSKFI